MREGEVLNKLFHYSFIRLGTAKYVPGREGTKKTEDNTTVADIHDRQSANATATFQQDISPLVQLDGWEDSLDSTDQDDPNVSAVINFIILILIRNPVTVLEARRNGQGQSFYFLKYTVRFFRVLQSHKRVEGAKLLALYVYSVSLFPCTRARGD